MKTCKPDPEAIKCKGCAGWIWYGAASDFPNRPLLLDLFCGGGGAAMGYYRAGFDIIGIDNAKIKRYPFPLIQGNALAPPVNLSRFDAFHASPPCQAFSAMQNIHKNVTSHPDLIEPTRQLLQSTNKPFIIENVENAPLRIDIKLCGSMFGLKIIRHRIFESNIDLPFLTPPCRHENMYDPWHYQKDYKKLRDAMDIHWLSDSGGGKRKGTIMEAIPPAYTEYLGGKDAETKT